MNLFYLKRLLQELIIVSVGIFSFLQANAQTDFIKRQHYFHNQISQKFAIPKGTGISYSTATGILRPHCIDGNTHLPMDSVKVTVFRDNSPISGAFTNLNGECRIGGLDPGEYDITFSKNSYAPFSFPKIKVTASGVTNIEMPLQEKIKFFFFKFSPQMVGYAIIGLIILLLILYSVVQHFGGVV